MLFLLFLLSCPSSEDRLNATYRDDTCYKTYDYCYDELIGGDKISCCYSYEKDIIYKCCRMNKYLLFLIIVSPIMLAMLITHIIVCFYYECYKRNNDIEFQNDYL
jgi:hypothetical protein